MPDILDRPGLSRPARKRASRVEQKQALPVLLYYRFHAADAKPPCTISMQEVEQQLEWLAAKGYRFLKLQAAVDALRQEQPAESPLLALIVDDADVSSYLLLFPLLRRRGIPLTLFVHPSAVSQSENALSWAQLGEMVLSGLVDVQYHPAPRAEVAPNGKRRSQWRERMELELGTRIEMLVWPYGSRTA